MEKFSAERYFLIGIYLQRVRNALLAFPVSGQVNLSFSPSVTVAFDAKDAKNFNAVCYLLIECCNDIGLEYSGGLITHFHNKVLKGDLLNAVALGQLEMIEESIKKEMENALFLYVPKEDSKYYDQMNPFGVGVADKFSSAIYEATEAGNCLALNRGTSCVFHLMRILEKGLHRLANHLSIEFPDKPLEFKQWGVVHPAKLDSQGLVC